MKMLEMINENINTKSLNIFFYFVLASLKDTSLESNHNTVLLALQNIKIYILTFKQTGIPGCLTFINQYNILYNTLYINTLYFYYISREEGKKHMIISIGEVKAYEYLKIWEKLMIKNPQRTMRIR